MKIWKFKFENLDLKIWKFKFENLKIWKFENSNLKIQIWKFKFENWNLKIQIWKFKNLKIWIFKFENSTLEILILIACIWSFVNFTLFNRIILTWKYIFLCRHCEECKTVAFTFPNWLFYFSGGYHLGFKKTFSSSFSFFPWLKMCIGDAW